MRKISLWSLLLWMPIAGMLATPGVCDLIEAHGSQVQSRTEAPRHLRIQGKELTSNGPNNPISFVLDASASRDRWFDVQHAIDACQPIDLTVWYDFGSMELHTVPSDDMHLFSMRIESELAEGEKAVYLTCNLEPNDFTILEWVRDEGGVRVAPPYPLPEAVVSHCHTASPE